VKKFFGNTEKSHLEERCFLLEQFMLKVYKTEYLLMSEELSLFARHVSIPSYTVVKALMDMTIDSVVFI